MNHSFLSQGQIQMLSRFSQRTRIGTRCLFSWIEKNGHNPHNVSWWTKKATFEMWIYSSAEINRENHLVPFTFAIPFIISATDNDSTISIITALEIADKVSISVLSPFIFTMISVFCNVSIEISVSIKLIVRSSLTWLFVDFFLFLSLTEAMITLYVVYAAIAIAGINGIFTGFCRSTINVTGTTRQRFRNKSNAADVI